VRGEGPGEARLTPASRAEWRAWLAEHHRQPSGVWVLIVKKGAGVPGPTYEEAVEEALCFGWIDSRMHRLDDRRFEQWFSPRRPGSVWARSNKERVERLGQAGRMAPAGREVVEAAVVDGSWTLLDEIGTLVVPADLATALEGAGTAGGFEELPASMRKQLLYWVATARRPQTRARRITAVVEAAADGRTQLPRQ